MVTDAQVRLLRQKMSEGKTQEAAAAIAGMSVRSARAWQRGPLPSETKAPRHWRTREDPFADVWATDIQPLLEADTKRALEAPTLVEVLAAKYPGRFGAAHVRTMQRRVHEWRALHGPPKDVVFPQAHVPGREAAIDFTHATELEVTIAGQALRHLLFEFVLSFSGWTWVMVCFAETFEALLAGLQGAFAALGGVPAVVRSDNLSAATHALRDHGGRGLTKRFRAVLDHYGTSSTRIRPGESHENGVVEQAHRRTKRALEQALVVRGSRDFPDVATYEAFVRAVVDRARNAGIAAALAVERAALRALPSAPLPAYTTWQVHVHRTSIIVINRRFYSVPSRLIGAVVHVRQYPDVLEVYYRDRLVERLPRLTGVEAHHRIDYRHVIWALVRKPGAFARYRYREELFPTVVFRQAYDALRASHACRADVEYVRVLHLAASTRQRDVECALELLLADARPFDYAAVRALVRDATPPVPVLGVPRPDLGVYDRLLAGGLA
jgi:hypothetical protein